MHNIYSYAMTGKKVGCGWFNLGQCLEITNSGTDVSYSEVCDVVGSEVEALESKWISECGSPNVLQNLLNNCGKNETILMRKWDYLNASSTNPVILYIVYNGDGRVVVTKCELKIKPTTGKIERVECEPEEEYAT